MDSNKFERRVCDSIARMTVEHESSVGWPERLHGERGTRRSGRSVLRSGSHKAHEQGRAPHGLCPGLLWEETVKGR